VVTSKDMGGGGGGGGGVGEGAETGVSGRTGPSVSPSPSKMNSVGPSIVPDDSGLGFRRPFCPQSYKTFPAR
jgi:hypothetical protein